MGELDGKVAIVTAGAAPLAGAIVKVFLEAGATVVTTSRRADEQEKLRARIGVPASASLSVVQVDLADEQAVIDAYAGVAQQHGGIDVLVNVAGGFGGGEPVYQTSWAVWQDQLDRNLKTAVISCRAAIPHMLGRAGAIVNIGTRTATQSGKNLAAYAASKRAVIQLTEALAAELLDQNITANVVLPSTIDTAENRQSDPTAGGGRWVQPEAIARAILFLAGPHARIISGATIPVYGRA
jgi:NAD(P)-dependent dehydrogenase (short-subunit alcohol dehydrogenase family)